MRRSISMLKRSWLITSGRMRSARAGRGPARPGAGEGPRVLFPLFCIFIHWWCAVGRVFSCDLNLWVVNASEITISQVAPLLILRQVIKFPSTVNKLMKAIEWRASSDVWRAEAACWPTLFEACLKLIRFNEYVKRSVFAYLTPRLCTHTNRCWPL